MFVLSLFPGIGLLDMAFEEEGFTVVRGPDLLWGGDIHRFHVPAGKFDGVIGGPPCKGESELAYLNGKSGETLVYEFARCIQEAQPGWWVMEAVVSHDEEIFGGTYPPCTCPGGPIGGSPYGSPLRHHGSCGQQVYITKLSPRWLGEKQSRTRFFHSNLNISHHLDVAVFEHPTFKHAVLASHGGREGSVVRGMATYAWEEMCDLQGLPKDFRLPGFTRRAAREAVGNGVPLPMGRAIARAVKRALAGGAW